MSVEIKELVIRAVVSRDGQDAPSSPSQKDKGSDDHDHKALVDAAVKEVLRILKAGKER